LDNPAACIGQDHQGERLRRGSSRCRACSAGEPPGGDHTPESFSSDVNRLIAAIERRVAAGEHDSPPATPASPPPVAPVAVDAECSAALAAFFAHRWDEVIEKLDQLLRVNPRAGRADGVRAGDSPVHGPRRINRRLTRPVHPVDPIRVVTNSG
jgi:hypothetical protein